MADSKRVFSPFIIYISIFASSTGGWGKPRTKPKFTVAELLAMTQQDDTND
tara:strand:- start:520 stop:672 length:153 start_codon:yes stop_codon:yes gene_type:complete